MMLAALKMSYKIKVSTGTSLSAYHVSVNPQTSMWIIFTRTITTFKAVIHR